MTRPRSWGRSRRDVAMIADRPTVTDLLRHHAGDPGVRLRPKAMNSEFQRRSNFRQASPSHLGKSEAINPGFETDFAARSPASP